MSSKPLPKWVQDSEHPLFTHESGDVESHSWAKGYEAGASLVLERLEKTQLTDPASRGPGTLDVVDAYRKGRESVRAEVLSDE